MKRSLFLLPALLLSTVAFAQSDSDGTETTEDGRQIRYQDVTEIEFRGLDIDGELVKPQVGLLSEVKRGEFAPMIRLRSDFNVEMSESVSDVK